MKFQLTTALALALIAASPAAAQDKKVIASASDIPALTVALPKKPSLLVVEGGPELDAIRNAVRAHAESMLRDYDIQDKTTAKQMRSVLMQIAMAENRFEDVLRLSGEIRALEDKPAARATTGLLSDAYARAALAVGEDSPGFRDAFKAEFEKSVAALDWAVAQDALQATRGQFQLISRDLLIGSLQGSLDANAEAQGMKVPFGMGAGLVGARTTLTETIPLKDVIFAVVDRRVQAEATQKEDLWTRRLVTLTPEEVKQPVTVAVWDGGLDPEVFAGRMWTNAKETKNGRDDDGNGFVDDVHGIAFDTDWKASTGSLRPMRAADLEGIGEKLKLVKGSLDLQAAVDSPEADAMRRTIGSLKPAEVMPFQLQMARVGLYLHGTATGFTSVEGNPAARVMHSRFDYKIEAVPDPMDEKVGEALAQWVRDNVAYYKANGVRVVNMSWRITEPQIAGSLASVEPDPEKRKARAKAIFDTVSKALEDSFASAPDILFVAGAGNEDEDVDFVRSFPAGINLPNVITVGAIDVSLQPAAFTSYGKSIDVYANGFEVPSRVPGGMPINISGTSLAAPYVTNLAAKLLAVKPDLKTAELRAIIEDTATTEGERALKVINPAAALARVR
ncbi:MAG: S8 family serine peptidase [Allosphingosinicella sp.]